MSKSLLGIDSIDGLIECDLYRLAKIGDLDWKRFDRRDVRFTEARS